MKFLEEDMVFISKSDRLLGAQIKVWPEAAGLNSWRIIPGNMGSADGISRSMHLWFHSGFHVNSNSRIFVSFAVAQLLIAPHPPAAGVRQSPRSPFCSDMPPGPTISVLIPAFNRERFIGLCIESILRQTYQNFKTLVAALDANE
jgi:hypothetical protein